ncbi:MAG: DNA/RNA nuclease SfsA, partial [Hungatella sp.]
GLHAMEQTPTLPVNGYDGEKFLPALRLDNIRREVTYGQSRFDLAFDMVFDMAFDMVFDSACAQLPDTPLISASAPARIPSSAPAFQSCTKPAFMEVKGVTLEENGIAMFPDAPTERGIKHILELTEAVKAGYEAYILFVIQMKGIREFTPNQKTHPQFGDALRLAHEAGVHILPYDCIVTADTLEIDRAVPVSLSTF